jgi:DnaJ like chaperone protein
MKWLVGFQIAAALLTQVLLPLLGFPLWLNVVAAAGFGLLIFFSRRADEVGPQSLRPRTASELLSEAEGNGELRLRADTRSEVSDGKATLSNILVPIFVELARSEGTVSPEQVRSIRGFFVDALAFNSADLDRVRIELKSALASPPQELDFLIKRARTEVRPELRVPVLRVCYQLCLTDGALRSGEREALRQLVAHFNLSDEQLQTVTNDFFGDGSAHYACLELNANASDDDVKSAFRRLAATYHPDKFASVDKASSEKASERFRAVNEAYEAIRQLRGF